MTNDFKELTACLCCNSRNLFNYLNLGDQAPCNALRSTPNEVNKKYPLAVNVCTNCYHSQLSIALDPKILYSNYSYRTGVSETLKKHYKELAIDAHDSWRVLNGSDKKLQILDIGCNDCTLLSNFRDLRCNTTGFDCYRPDNHNSVDQFIIGGWNQRSAEVMKSQFDIICGTNVLAHNDYPKDFLRYCETALINNGIAVFEFPYAKDLITYCEFDTYYHEHISYFSINSFINLLDDTGLFISKLVQNGVHGGSIRFYLEKCIKGKERSSHCQEVKGSQRLEGLTPLTNMETYKSFQWKVNNIAMKLRYEAEKVKLQGLGFVAFGASGKGSVLLKYCNLHPDYIVDETPSKIGKYSPEIDIPIVDLQRLKEDDRILCHLILSWNCMEESLNKIWQKRKNEYDLFLSYVPEVSIGNISNFRSQKCLAN